LDRDLREFVELLNARGIDFVVIGAHALAFHALPRYTKDLDLFVRVSAENAEKLSLAVRDFEGVKRFNPEDFQDPGYTVQIGVEPNRIDLVTDIDGVDFNQVWANKVSGNLDGVPVFFISLDDYLTNKRAAGRPQDLADAHRAEEIARGKTA
jgi:predicted nucleotidyltransferase